jgi:hypothetical protein
MALQISNNAAKTIQNNNPCIIYEEFIKKKVKPILISKIYPTEHTVYKFAHWTSFIVVTVY